MNVYIECAVCGGKGNAELPPCNNEVGFLACPQCGEPVSKIGVEEYRPWIENQVQKKADLHANGELGTRKQSLRQSDTDIDRDGLAAELAACLLLAPGFRLNWKMCCESNQGNRGRDLPNLWLNAAKHVEIKQTRHKTPTTGYLLVRPPRWTPGRMTPKHIDDCLYVLLYGRPYFYELLGWADKDLILEAGKRNPVPMAGGQRECWGIHWSKLRNTKELACTDNGRTRA